MSRDMPGNQINYAIQTMFEVDEKEIHVFGNEWRVRIASVTASRTK